MTKREFETILTSSEFFAIEDLNRFPRRYELPEEEIQEFIDSGFLKENFMTGSGDMYLGILYEKRTGRLVRAILSSFYEPTYEDEIIGVVPVRVEKLWERIKDRKIETETYLAQLEDGGKEVKASLTLKKKK